MPDKTRINCDLLVIGAGVAGMSAAARASDLGLKTVLTGSSAGFYLFSGLLDFLGVYPVNPPVRLSSPGSGLATLQEENPHHPYARVSGTEIINFFEYVHGILLDNGLKYVYDKDKNSQVLTAAGTFKPTFLVPETMAPGCALYKEKTPVLLVDFNGLKGYSARQILPHLKRLGHRVETLSIDVPQLAGDFNVNLLARQFEDDTFVENIAEKINSYAPEIRLAGFPAVCGIHDSPGVLKKIRDITGITCFEIPGLPPSIPGLRLKNAFEKKLSQNSVTILNNSLVQYKTFENTAMVLDAAYQNINTQIKTRGVILATGRFTGGGLHARREGIRETVFNIPVTQPDQRSQWYDIKLFSPDGHGINQAGIRTDEFFRPKGRPDHPAFNTLYAAGSVLSGNDWARLKSGAGVSIVSACRSVDHFYDLVGGK